MTYQEELDVLLQNYLDRYEKNSSVVEFYISPTCNQQCEYCYLYRYGRQLYPPKINKPELILNNLKLILNYLDDNGYKYNEYDLFSGEFFNLSYWEDILQIIAEHNIKIGHPQRVISIPTNMSFILDEEKTKKIETWIKYLHEQANVHLVMSGSVDGPEDLESIERPSNKFIKTEEFYDKMFEFSKKHRYAYHPMITKEFVKNYKKNYDWWIDNIIKHDNKIMNGNYSVYSIPMFLEVRNPEQWDDESLENYRQFLWYVAEKDIKSLHNGNIEEFAVRMVDDFSEVSQAIGRYNHVQPYLLSFPVIQNKMACGIQRGPIIRLGDLALIPCHRTSYENFIYGNFITDEEKTKIIGIHALNPILAIKIKTLNPSRSYMMCGDCSIKSFCLKGCLGSQYETEKELFAVQPEICKLYKTKFKTIYEIAEHYKIYDIINNSLGFDNNRREFINYERKLLKQLQRDE